MPHYSDYNRHPRRGDIIVSFPEAASSEDESEDFVYAHFEMQKTQNTNQIVSKTWMPASNELYKIVNNIRKQYDQSMNARYPWEGLLNLLSLKMRYNFYIKCDFLCLKTTLKMESNHYTVMN